jgi:hypothetical protein
MDALIEKLIQDNESTETYEPNPLLRHDSIGEDETEISLEDKRITLLVNCHGLELLNNPLPETGLKVRVFSQAGKLGICSVANVGLIGEFAQLLKANFAEILQEYDNSTYKMLKDMLKTNIKNYGVIVDMHMKDLLEQLKQETAQKSPDARTTAHRMMTLSKDVIKTKKAIASVRREEHIRNYVPVVDKEYDFGDRPDEYQICVLHHDPLTSTTFGKYKKKIDVLNQNIAALDFSKMETIRTLFNEAVASQFVDSKVYLGQMLPLLEALGFTVVNIVDYTCRSVEEEYTSLIKEVEAVERSIPINRRFG